MMRYLSGGISKSASVDCIDVSPETLWSTILDIDAMPRYAPNVTQVKIIDNSNSFADKLHRHDDSSDQSTSDKAFLHCNGIMKEGFAWEEVRFHPLLKKHIKIIKQVTRVGGHSISTDGDCDRSATTSDMSDFNKKSTRRQKHRMFVTVNITSPEVSFRYSTETYTTSLEWEEVIETSETHCSNTSNGTLTTATVTSSLDRSSTTPSPRTSSSKCQIVITVSFLTESLYFLALLKFFQFCGMNRLADNYLRSEIDAIISEAIRREHE